MIDDAEKKNLISPGKVNWLLLCDHHFATPISVFLRLTCVIFIEIDNFDRADVREHGDQHGFHGGHERVQDDPNHALLHKLGEEGHHEGVRSRADPH